MQDLLFKKEHRQGIFSYLNILRPAVTNSKQIYFNYENENHEQLVQTLLNCVLACENCAAQGFTEGQTRMMEKCIPMDIDCADICMQAARLLKRNSAIAHEFLAICEKACRMCAEECAKHDHEHCEKCAQACNECADACHAHHGNIQVN